MEETDKTGFNWNIEYHDGYYFFISACSAQENTGHVLKPDEKLRCFLLNKLRGPDARMTV